MKLASRIALYLGLTALAVFIIGPVVWLGLHAFAKTWSAPALLPQEWSLTWWSTVFADNSLIDSIVQSFEFAPTVTLLSALICLPAAYAFGRMKFAGRQVLLVSLFATNAFPKVGLFAALATLFYSLHLMGSFAGVVIVQMLGTVVFMTWIPAAAFAGVSRHLEEAARDVGASRWRVFFRITLPLAMPGILVAVILSFLAAFDEAQGTYMVGAPNYVTMPTEMYTLVLNYPEGAAAVFSIVLSVPSVLLLMLVRKHVMGGHLAEGFQLK